MGNKNPKGSDNTQVAILLICLNIFLFLNTLNNDFTYDDSIVVKNNPYLKGEADVKNLFLESRVIRTISLLVDHKLFGFNPVGYHIQNILWHGLATILLFFLLSNLSKDKTFIITVSLLFTVHPIHVEAIANVSNRKELLCLSFSLLSLLFFQKSYYFDGIKKKSVIFLSLLMFLLAILSKQVAVFLPFMALAYHIYFHTHRDKRLIYLTYFLSIATLLLVCAFLDFRHQLRNILSQSAVYVGGSGWVSYKEYLLTSIKSILFYLKLLLWPVNLSPDHSFVISTTIWDSDVQVAIFVWLALIFLIVRLRKTAPIISYGLLWLIASLLPVMIIPGATFFMAERYLYIPSVGFIIAFSAALSKLTEYRYLITSLLFFSIIGFHSLNTINRNSIWENDLTLLLDTLKKNPESTSAHLGLATIFNNEGKPEIAIPHYLKALKGLPKDPAIWNNLGFAYEKLGEYDKAFMYYEKALKLAPHLQIIQQNITLLEEKVNSAKTNKIGINN